MENTDFEGQSGGAIHKVIRWAFEQQGLYQPPGAPRPVTTPLVARAGKFEQIFLRGDQMWPSA
ncbi:MAG: hypothetical protein AB4062_02540 [Crocosphaera sp.]